MYFGKDKAKSILFKTWQNGEELGIKFRETEVNHRKHVGFLGCILNEVMLDEAMTFRETQISISKTDKSRQNSLAYNGLASWIRVSGILKGTKNLNIFKQRMRFE